MADQSIYNLYLAHGIIPKPVAYFGAPPQRVTTVPSAQFAGTGPIEASRGVPGVGLIAIAPLSPTVQKSPVWQDTLNIPGPYLVMQRRTP